MEVSGANVEPNFSPAPTPPFLGDVCTHQCLWKCTQCEIHVPDPCGQILSLRASLTSLTEKMKTQQACHNAATLEAKLTVEQLTSADNDKVARIDQLTKSQSCLVQERDALKAKVTDLETRLRDSTSKIDALVKDKKANTAKKKQSEQRARRAELDAATITALQRRIGELEVSLDQARHSESEMKAKLNVVLSDIQKSSRQKKKKERMERKRDQEQRDRVELDRAVSATLRERMVVMRWETILRRFSDYCKRMHFFRIALRKWRLQVAVTNSKHEELQLAQMKNSKIVGVIKMTLREWKNLLPRVAMSVNVEKLKELLARGDNDPQHVQAKKLLEDHSPHPSSRNVIMAANRLLMLEKSKDKQIDLKKPVLRMWVFSQSKVADNALGEYSANPGETISLFHKGEPTGSLVKDSEAATYSYKTPEGGATMNRLVLVDRATTSRFYDELRNRIYSLAPNTTLWTDQSSTFQRVDVTSDDFVEGCRMLNEGSKDVPY